MTTTLKFGFGKANIPKMGGKYSKDGWQIFRGGSPENFVKQGIEKVQLKLQTVPKTQNRLWGETYMLNGAILFGNN